MEEILEQYIPPWMKEEESMEWETEKKKTKIRHFRVRQMARLLEERVKRELRPDNEWEAQNQN